MDNRTKASLREWKESKLLPSVFDALPQVFPSMDFRKDKKGNWVSLYHINGELSKSGDKTKPKSQVSRNRYPNRIFNTDGDYHNGQRSIDLVEFYQYKEGVSFVEALRQMAERSGVESPEFSPEDTMRYEKEKKEQDGLLSITERMRETLFLPEGKEVLEYLTRTKADGGRGYSEELIKSMGLGCITPDLAKELREVTKDGGFTTFPSGLGSTFRLMIAREEKGKIVGFNFRRIDGEKDKYRYLQKDGVKALSALPFLRLTRDYEKDYDLTITEGELDALHAQAVGLENVCATGREIKDAKETFIRLRRFDGLRRITILFDRGEDKTEEKIKTAIRVIRESGLSAYVSLLPTTQDESGEDIKIDLDEFLLTHTPEEARRTINENSLTATNYLLKEIISRYAKKAQEEGRLDRERLLEEVAELYFTTEAYIEKDEIVKTIAYSIYNNGLKAWTEDSLRRDLENYSKRQNDVRISNEAKAKLSSFEELLKSGDLDELAQDMEEFSNRIKSGRVRDEVEDILRDMSEEEAFDMLGKVPQGIETKYEFTNENRTITERLIIPQGAITIIGAPTSHGKSTLLRNLALDMAEKLKDDEAILYFTFEEEKSAVLTQFLNSYANVVVHEPSKKYPQIKAIRAYLASKRTKAEYMNESKTQEFSDKVDEYMRRGYLRKVKIIDKDFDAASLINTLRGANNKANIKAVFIDYVQLMRKTGYKANRAEELKEICISLNTFAKETQLPVIIASQLTRSINSPSGLSNSSLSESSDIEKSANTIICLWNGIEKSGVGLSKAEEDEVKAIEKRGGCTFGNGGFIYAKLTKNRGGVKNLEAFLPYSGETGRILSKEDKGNGNLFSAIE